MSFPKSESDVLSALSSARLVVQLAQEKGVVSHNPSYREPLYHVGAILADAALQAGLSVSCIVLLTLDVGLHVSRRRQSHGMAKRLEFARPMVRRCARLNADQTRRQLLEERQDRAALQLAADDHLTSGINSVNLEHRLGNVETDCRDRLHR